tara:strand:+ start:305 stop:565 length:261 start_codon:yes stop_codon:yes gene_type:complete
MMGLSKQFEDQNLKNSVICLASLLFLVSIHIAQKAKQDFIFYLNNVKDTLPSYVPVKSWYEWTYINNFYIFTNFIFFILTILSIFR